jgi:EAL domain-containing protein (putative c-di-GMP-specific phosphodiesterase class I)
VSIDHFGIGERSMEYMKDVSIDTLKVDPTITDQLGADESADRIVRAIIAAGHAQGKRVIADRVTTAEQMKTLSDFDFDFIQGAFVSRPLSAEQIKDRLRTSQSIGAGRIL